ncbi:MAG: flagellar biosynthetic protein FliR [Succinivibrio sp.]|nr:flagellar biosynthetic protein FliR [Succinivibrio sp.]
MDDIESIALAAVAAYVWPLCRIAGFCGAMFPINGRGVPTRVRAMFAIVFTVCVMPSIPAPPADLELLSLGGFITTMKEVLIGIAIGYMTQFLAQVFVMAGQVVAMQTGLGFASLVDPVSGTNTPVVGQFFTVLTTLVFLGINGHLLFFKLLLMSYDNMPIGGAFLPPAGLNEIFTFGSVMFMSALAMAISSCCTMLVVNFTFGVMTRAAPQLNIFSMGFAVSMTVGLVVLTQTLNAFMGNFLNTVNAITETTCSLIGTSCTGIF